MDLLDPRFHPYQFLTGADIGDHDLWPDVNLFPQGNGRSLKNGLNLHVVDFRKGDATAHPPVAQHGVVFMEDPDPAQHFFPFFQELLIQTFGLEFTELPSHGLNGGHMLVEFRVQHGQGARQLL